MSALVTGLMMVFSGTEQACAQEAPTSASGPQLVLSTALAQSDIGGGNAVKNERTLSTRPVGTHVFKTLAEVDDPAALKPGEKVDVKLVTIGDEGPKAERILRSIVVYSTGEWQPDDGGLADVPAVDENGKVVDESAANEDPAVKQMRVVGLLVTGTQMETLRLAEAQGVIRVVPAEESGPVNMFAQIWHNFTANLFQPLLLFFFMGFAVPLLHVPLEFPKPLYQSLTIYLLVAIGWHGGELMASQSPAELKVAAGLVVVGFFINAFIGMLATKLLEWFTPMRKIDSVTVGAYYGSDSAGTFVTCLGILATLGILHDSYMPVLLAVMEIPGCLVGLYLVSRLRHQGMDAMGNMPGEPEYALGEFGQKDSLLDTGHHHNGASAHADDEAATTAHRATPKSLGAAANLATGEAESPAFNWKILHEVFFNPGLYLLFGGIAVGFISGLQAAQDPHVVEGPNHLFIFMFKGALCLFLLEMGITACRHLRDLKTAGWGFIAFGLLAPNLFACIGMTVLHLYSIALGHPFHLGTYALFAVLCGAASYIAVPAVQRLAIPEASPTLPLAASLGLTFTWNVTLGIPIYIQIAKGITSAFPVT